MNRALLKDTLREIRHTLSRFLSIFFIVLLGVSFFAGIKATSPEMKKTSDKYYDDFSLMDIHVVSTMGLTQSDVDAVKDISGVEQVYPSYSLDAILNLNNWDYVVRVFALESKASDSPTGINGMHLIEGRLPKAWNECLVERGHDIYPTMPIGSVLSLKSGTDRELSEDIHNIKYTVVGVVVTPYYISNGRGISGVGSGNVNSFIMVPEQNFKLDVYTNLYLTVKNAKDLLSYSVEYTDTVEQVKTALTDISSEREQDRYDGIVDEAYSELNESKQELAEAEQTQRIELGKARKELQDAEEQIKDGREQIEENEAKLEKAMKKARNALKAGYAELQKGEEQYSEQLALFTTIQAQAETELPAADAQIAEAEKQIADSQALLDTLKAQLANDPTLSNEQKAQLQAQITAGDAQLEETIALLTAAKAELAAKREQLAGFELQLAEGREKLENGKKQLSAAKAKINREEKKAKEQIEDAKIELEDAIKDFGEGKEKYDSLKKESDEEIADAHQKIDDAEKDISEIDLPEWYILDREDNNPGYKDYGETADRMDAIAQIFPVFFILVTALVCLTTTTRMVDEQRTYIGTLKALGYSKVAITSKYLIYAALASFLGSIAGVFLGFSVFPSVIGSAYGSMYFMPPMQTGFYLSFAIISITFAVLTTTVSAWAACYKELKENPAALTRPKAPQPGKRVLLERVTVLWSKLSFMKKIVLRNMFRYKKRFAMTVIGIAGCMALMLSAFGLRDSISTIGEKQFAQLDHSNMIIALTNEDSSLEEVISTIEGDSRIVSFIPVKEQVVTVSRENVKQDVNLYIPESADKLRGFKTLRDRITGTEFLLSDQGVVITEKLADMLGVSIGDSISMEDGDHNKGIVKVASINEHYVSHAIYMAPHVYSEVFGNDPVFNEVITKNTSTETDFENALSTDLMKEDAVSAVGFYKYVKQEFDKGITSLYYVVLVLIISAGALAVVVLYNLTNINIMERLREIATIKVLGFYNLEVSSYVFWENALLTSFGIILGSVLGIFLHKIVIVSAETQSIMFGRNIFFPSYIYALLLTVFFMVVVNFFMFFRLRRINMVESLKSID